LFVFGATAPPLGHDLLNHEVSRSHTATHHSRYDSSGRVISSSQRPLLDNTHNTHNIQTSIPTGGFEPTLSAGERPQTYALDCADRQLIIGKITFINFIYKTRTCAFVSIKKANRATIVCACV